MYYIKNALATIGITFYDNFVLNITLSEGLLAPQVILVLFYSA